MAASCAGCGSSLSDDALFCEMCGRTVTEPEAPSAPTPAPDRQTGEEEAFPTSVSTARPTGGAPLQAERAATTQLSQFPWLRSKKLWIGVAVVLVVVLVGVFGVRYVLDQRSKPEPAAAVNGFFAGLAKRDASAALQWLDPHTTAIGHSPSSKVLLTDKALKSKWYHPPKNMKIESIVEARDGDGLTANVAYTVDKRRWHVGFRLALNRDFDPPRYLVNQYGDDGVTSELYLNVGAPYYRINDVVFKAKNAMQSINATRRIVVSAFPGQYRVGVPDNPLYQAPPQDVNMTTNGGVADLKLGTTLKGSGVTEVRRQVKAFIDSCAAQHTLTPKYHELLCPFTSNGSVEGADRDQKNIGWSVVRYPTYQVIVQGAQDEGGVVVEQGDEREDSGQARISYNAEDETGKRKDISADNNYFTIRGQVDLERGKIVYDPNA